MPGSFQEEVSGRRYLGLGAQAGFEGLGQTVVSEDTGLLSSPRSRQSEDLVSFPGSGVELLI